jgi:hypothetical protein
MLVLNDGDLTQPRATIAQVGDDLPQTRPDFAIEELYTRFIRPRIFNMSRHADAGDVVIPDDVARRENLEDLDRFVALVNSQGGQMILAFLPLRSDIPAQSAPAEDVIRAWTAKNDVPLIDLTAAVASHPVSEICLYDHTHFNRVGNAIIGQAILKLWPASLRQ